MKKIIIVSYYYSPANIMGAVRASKISKYLDSFGYDVKVICSESNKLLFMPEDVGNDSILKSDTNNIHKIIIDHSIFYKKLASFLKLFSKRLYKVDNIAASNNKSINIKKQKRFSKKIIHFATFFMSLIQDYDFLFSVKRSLSKTNTLEYDIVISTYGPIASHLIGRYLKKIKPSSMWIADFRDPIAQPTNGLLEMKINKRLEKDICGKADKITAVSQGYLKEIVKREHMYKSEVITNGFDPNDLLFLDGLKEDNLFSLVYTGTTYGGKRDLSPIFKALNELIEENKIDRNRIVFRYAGSEQNHVKNLASKYGLVKNIDSYSYIPRKEALTLQANSKLLVVSTWNEEQHEGVLPGKFLEYMMFKKPIIAIVNGSVAKSEISNIINDYKLGVSYEDINRENDFIKLKEYIYKQYEYFSTNQTVLFDADLSNVQNHSYMNIAKKFINIFNEKIN